MYENYKTGEQLARRCLEANGYQVIDRRESREYWLKDVDFSVSKNGKSFDIEVKWDNKISDSGAMFIELITNIQEGRIGWANYTEADVIFYGDAMRQVFYVFGVDDMREYIKTHIGEYRTQTANDYNKNTGQIVKQSLGAIVPIEDFKHYYEVQEIDITERLKKEPRKWPCKAF